MSFTQNYSDQHFLEDKNLFFNLLGHKIWVKIRITEKFPLKKKKFISVCGMATVNNDAVKKWF